MKWSKIHAGPITKDEILVYTQNSEWQKLRLHLKQKPLIYRYCKLRNYLNVNKNKNKNTRAAQVQVTNYINALARGGLIKPWKEEGKVI